HKEHERLQIMMQMMYVIDTRSDVASLVYRVSSRTARAIQRNPVSKNQKRKKEYIMFKFHTVHVWCMRACTHANVCLRMWR
ncbi:mCG1035267, partial [Mus musculus]